MKAIVVLGADAERCKKRFDAALPLYIPDNSVVIISGFDWNKHDEAKKYVLSKGMQHNIKIEEEPESRTTEENAVYSFKKMDELDIREADIVSGSSQVARAKRYFKKNNKGSYKLNFYAAPEGLRIALKHYPREITKYMASFMPEYIDEVMREDFKKLFR